MSFSVKAKEFVPSRAAAPWGGGGGEGVAESGCTGSPHNGAAAARQQQQQKERVCMAYYECCECPFGDSCAHAHRFFELSPDAQSTLLMTVSVDSIPGYFLSPTPSPTAASHRSSVCGSGQAASSGPASFTPYGRFYASLSSGSGSPHRTGSFRSGGAARRNYRDESVYLTPTAMDAASISSGASSSNAGSPNRSSAKAGPPMALERFSMHLPARCRYPHKGVSGTYYSFLGLPRTASQGEVIAKYRLWQREAFKRMRSVDPVGAEAADRIIVEARNVLGKPSLRAEYDRSLPPPPTPGRGSAAQSAVGKWSSATKHPQTPTPAGASIANKLSSIAGTCSPHGRAHHGHSSSSSTSSTASCGGNALQDKTPLLPTLTTNMFSDDIW